MRFIEYDNSRSLLLFSYTRKIFLSSLFEMNLVDLWFGMASINDDKTRKGRQVFGPSCCIIIYRTVNEYVSTVRICSDD